MKNAIKRWWDGDDGLVVLTSVLVAMLLLTIAVGACLIRVLVEYWKLF